MSITVRIKDNDDVEIAVAGRFDVAIQREFRQAYESLEKGPSGRRYLIKLDKADYMDSAALGMLLHLQKFTGARKADLHISGANDTIRRTLSIAGFERFFTIE